MSKTFFAVLTMGIVASLTAGCSCNESVRSGCVVDDDCRAKVCMSGEIQACSKSGMCECNPDIPLGEVGRFSSMALRGPTAYVAAYNTTYGDLMIGDIVPPGVISNWSFVDGVPENTPPDNALSHVRGGITGNGDDVGKYCSLAVTKSGDPVVSYYDVTNGQLKFASFGAVRWHTHVVDKGIGSPTTGDDIGRYTSLTLAKDGSPGIAYYAEVAKGASGMREGQLRFAQAKVVDPQSASDWTVSIIVSAPMGTLPDPTNPPALRQGVALFVAAARKPDFGPMVAYYDNSPAGADKGPHGNLVYVEFDATGNKWQTPIILDGEGPMGGDTGDVGQYPSLTVGLDGVGHISYVDATHDNLLYVNTKTRTPEVVDDGYRPKDETTMDGLPSPVYHLVGDSSSIQLLGDQVLIAYQDSTVEQLRFAARDTMKNTWTLTSVAGHDAPFAGSYGFYAQNRIFGSSSAIVSSYAINQHVDPQQFYVEVFGVTLQSIIP